MVLIKKGQLLYHIGDFVLCRTSDDDKIVFDVDFNDQRYGNLIVKALEVIGVLDDKYYIVLTPDQLGDFVIDENFIRKYKVDKKFLRKAAAFVREPAVGGRKYIDPYSNTLACNICKEYVPYAIANQDDGTLICWVCRTTRVIK